MQAHVIESHDGPRGLVLSEVPDPVPEPGQLLVEIEAVALNRADLLQCHGKYPGPPMDHEIPGLEFSGVVRSETAGSDLASGDRVMGLVSGGAFAERIAVRPELLLRLPDRLDAVSGAAVPEAHLTAYDALVLQAGLREGAQVLVHAVASGVGLAALQIAGEVGARVAGTCSAGKVARVQELGAELVVDRAEEFVAPVREWAPNGVAAILDLVGGQNVDAGLRMLASQGTIVVLGLLAGRHANVDLARLLARRARLMGSVLRGRTLAEKADLVASFQSALGPALAAGRLAPVIDSVLPFAELGKGLERMAANANVGKIVCAQNPVQV